MTYDSLSSMYCHGVRLVALLESLITYIYVKYVGTAGLSWEPGCKGQDPSPGGEHVVCLDTAVSFGVDCRKKGGFSSLPPVTCVLGAMHRPVVHTDSCSAWDRTTGLPDVACM